MLLLARKIGDVIIIDGDIKITVTEIQRGQVKLGIEAPEEAKVYREELLEKIRQ